MTLGAGPHPEPAPPPFTPALDRPFDGVIELEVDVSDVDRGIYWTRLRIPVAQSGPMTLLYPKWLPGYHSPAASIELLAGIEIRAAGQVLAWRRDPVEVHAFHIEIPEAADRLDVALQYLTPTAPSQGTVVATAEMLSLAWNTVMLYPAGYYSRRIEVAASVKLAPGWSAACALEIERQDGEVIKFRQVTLDLLVDSPLMAGKHVSRVELAGDVQLHLFADRPELLAIRDEQIAPHRELVVQADRLFRSRHFGRYAFLVGLSDELGAAGVEHHCSCEICTAPTYFTQWERNAPKRDVFAHEYVHSWNGKYRRGADSWTASFERPIGNSLMWVYEGLTQYYGQVLAARCGLWTAEQAREALGLTAAIYNSCRPGGRWRPMSDTTRDPIIASRSPLPWASWQRSEDYYSEGQLMWLDIDTLIRERSGDTRSLDDFARAFFGGGGQERTSLYRLADVVAGLNGVVEHDWAALLETWLENRRQGTFLAGLERGGYRLIYKDTPAPFCVAGDSLNNAIDLRFSIGLLLSTDGLIQEVVWQSPAFEAGLTAGSTIVAINRSAFEADIVTDAVASTATGAQLQLVVKRHNQLRTVSIVYRGGPRYPGLEPIGGARRRLDELLAPLPALADIPSL